jgi:hypothetical protein
VISYKAMRGYVVFTGKQRCFRTGETEFPQLVKGSKFKVLCGNGPYKYEDDKDYWEYMVEVPAIFSGWHLGTQDDKYLEIQTIHKVDANTMVRWVTTNEDRCKYIPHDVNCSSSCNPCIGNSCPFKDSVKDVG